MKTIRWYLVLAVMILIHAPVVAYEALAEEKIVTEYGEAVVGNKPKEVYKQEALNQAFRKAVEKELGMYIQSNSQIKDGKLIADEIITKAPGYVHDYEILEDGIRNSTYYATVDMKIASEQIGADFKQLVSRTVNAMDRPAIAFVLTTWEKRGFRTQESQTASVKREGEAAYRHAGADSKESVSDSSNVAEAREVNRSAAITSSGTATVSVMAERIDETLWKKMPDMTINDAFQQEFLEKNFTLTAPELARNVAITESLIQTAVNPFDRSAVRDMAEKEGANYVARGEIKVIDVHYQPAERYYVATSQVGVEIVDVSSGDVVASYSNSFQAPSAVLDNAKGQSIKKASIGAARVLGEQVINNWQDRLTNGVPIKIEIQNISSMRKQKRVIKETLEAVQATISSSANPSDDVLLMVVRYKGRKDDLSDEFLSKLEGVEGFSEDEFEGPINQGGKIVFKFTKLASKGR